MTVSRQLSGLTSFQYCGRIQRDSGNTSTASLTIYNAFESGESYRFAGQPTTISFYARAGANYSGGGILVGVQTGTGTDQNPITSVYTGGATTILQTTATPTTTWTRYQYTGTLPSTTTELNINFGWTPTGTAGTNDYIEITGVQLELGSVATTFKRAGGTLQGELAACQRYYFKDAKTVLRADQVIASSIVYGVYYLPQEMRTTPTLTQTGGATETSNTSATTLSNDGSSSNTRKTGIYVTGGLSTGTVYMYRVVEWSAEL
jgi:hypothetical protein